MLTASHWLQAAKITLIRGLFAFVLLGPLTGLILNGFQINVHWQRPCWITLAIMLAVFVFELFKPVVGLLRQRGTRLAKPHPIYVKPISQKLSWFHYLVLLCSLLAPFLLYKTLGNYGLASVILAFIYVLLGLGLNIVVGLAGLLDLGFVAFYAVGAYTYALGAEYLGIGFWVALPLGATLAACLGCLLAFPVLKMHGDYLAIVTLGFGEIIRLILNNWATFTHGPNGVMVDKPTLFGLSFARRGSEDVTTIYEFFHLDYSNSYFYFFMYFLCLACVIVVILLVERLKSMPLGKAWEALREDEVACRSVGINPVTTKLLAFSIGAFIGGVAGVLFAAHQQFVSPTSFTFIESAMILAIVVLGGMGSTRGVIIAAFLVTLLPEVLRGFSEYRMLLFGILMISMMIWRPKGLIRLTRPLIERPALHPHQDLMNRSNYVKHYAR